VDRIAVTSAGRFSPLGPRAEKTAQYRAMPTKDLQYGIIPIDRTELEATLTAIKQFAERALKFQADVSDLLASSQQKSG
jgi:hypothetical protein